MIRAAFNERPLWFCHLMALATISIWSFSFLFIVKINREMTPLGVVALRLDIFGVFILALLAFRRPCIRGLSAKQWSTIIALSLVGGIFYHSIFAWSAGRTAGGASRIDPALLGLILATIPVHTGWLGWIFLRERLNAPKLIALALGLAGVIAVLLGRHGRIDLLPRENLEGPIAATIAAMFGGGIAVLARASRTIYRPLDLVIVSGLLMLVWNLLLHPFAQLGDVAGLSFIGWFAAIFLGLFGNGVAFLTWTTALSKLQAVTAATYLFMASVLAALWGWLFDATPIGWSFAFGAVLVLAGLLLMARAGMRDRSRAALEIETRRAAEGRGEESGEGSESELLVDAATTESVIVQR